MARISARWLVSGALVAVALLAANVAFTYHNTQELYRNATWVAHTHEVLLALENVLSLAKDAETGQRGYLITGDERYLAPYTAAVGAIHHQADTVERLTADNPDHQRRMPELHARIDAKLDELNRTIILRRAEGSVAARAVVLSGQGKAEMDALRGLVGEMSDQESILRQVRADRRDRTFRLAIVEGLISGLCAFLAVVAFLLLYQRHAASRARATFTIAEQAERLRTTLSSIGDAVIATDTDGRITMMNAIAELLTGWTLTDARNEPLATVFNIVNETTRQTVESPVTRALREGVIVGLANHTILIARDGTERPIDDSAAPIRCAQGELVGCVLVFRDITERKSAELVLQQSEARKTAMFEAALDCIISIDHKGSVIEFNAAAERTFGYRREEAIGRELASLIIPPAYQERHRKGLAHYVATGEGPVLNQRLELSALRADGTEFPVELTVTRIPAGGSPTFTAYLRDLTERKTVDESLRRSEERLQLVANFIPQPAWMATGEGWIFWYNQRWFDYTGNTQAEMEGWGWEKVHDPAELPRVMEKWKSALASDQPWEDTFPLRRHDGQMRWHLSRAMPQKDATGKVVFWFGTNTDVSEQRMMQEELRAAKESAELANVAKDNFLSTLSHELRTPLTPVLATLGAWEQSSDFPASLADDLQMIRRNVDLEARLIDDLLDITRIARGKLALNLEVMNVQKLLDSVVGMYRSEIQAKRIELTQHSHAQQCFVKADPGRLQQAFWNLLKNAVKFTAEGGMIDITTRNEARGQIQIVVHDNGIGISPEMLLRLFTPFEQETYENIKRYGGLGLGLAITRTLLEAQNGQISAHSDGKYRGATFVITLPCVEPPAEREAAPSNGDSDAGPKHDKCFRLLLVEDHLDTARVLARLIGASGHEVTMAHSVADALSALQRKPFDILVSDIGLPDGTGIDLIRQVRQQYGAKLPAVALTGYGMEEDVARCINAGFTHHLTKPVNFAKLEQAIQRIGSNETG